MGRDERWSEQKIEMNKDYEVMGVLVIIDIILANPMFKSEGTSLSPSPTFM